MISSERKLLILRMLREQGVVNIKAVAVQTGISETTVRRDFEQLEKEGRLHRVPGGAMLNSSMDTVIDSAQPSMRSKKNLKKDEKIAVASRAAECVSDGDSVFVDVGTSLLPLGEILMKRKVQIVTNNTLLLNQSGGIVADIFVLGGQYTSNYNLICGPLAKQMIAGFRFDHSFIGCFGLSVEQGKAYTLDVDSAAIKIAGMENSTHVHLLADTSKLGRNGFFAFADLSDFESVYCNTPEDGMILPSNFVIV